MVTEVRFPAVAPDAGWTTTTRKWTLSGWLFLTLSMLFVWGLTGWCFYKVLSFKEEPPEQVKDFHSA